MNSGTKIRFSILSLSSLALMLVFQNCGAKFEFTSSVAGAALVTTTTPTGDAAPDLDAAQPQVPGKAKPGVACDPDLENCDISTANKCADFIECELGSANNKIILSSNLVLGSNAQATRLCMSENACLNLVNAYASARNCAISTGAPAQVALNRSNACTAIFPGSKGTCKNANVISDDQVVKILSAMGGPI